MKLHILCLLVSCLALTFDLGAGYGGGAPNGKNVCASLIPGHGTKQIGEAPYRLIVSDVEGQIQISLRATAQVTFAGFIVQAKNADARQEIVDGQFARHENSQPKTCATGKDNTWTHTNGQPKTEVETAWAPPAMYNGSVAFQGTVVQVKQAYWPEIFSEPIYFLMGEVVDQQTYQEYLKDKSEDKSSSSSSASAAASQSGNGLAYGKCGNHVCLGLGEAAGCLPAKTCEMLLVAKQASGENRFHITAKPASAKSRYFSAAFSDDTKMGDDLVVDCIVDSRGTVKMGVSINNGKTNKLAEGGRSVLKNVHVSNVDGVIGCEWTMDNNFQVDRLPIALADKHYYLLLASGEVENDAGEKGYHDMRLPSSEPVNLASVGTVAESKDLSFLIKIHGGLMILAWIGTVSIGIMFARYFKDSWPDTLIRGVKVWFAFHRPLMVFSIVMMCIAQGCIFYYVGGYRAEAHQIVGSIAFLCAILQPLGALFRPHPEASTRWIFNWAHWFGGNLGQILAVVAILLATKLKIAALPQLFFYVVLVWIVFHVFAHLTMMLHTACSSRSKTGDIALHELQNGQQIYIESSAKRSGQGFRTFMLFIYSMVTATFCALLIGLVIMPDTIMEYF